MFDGTQGVDTMAGVGLAELHDLLTRLPHLDLEADDTTNIDQIAAAQPAADIPTDTDPPPGERPPLIPQDPNRDTGAWHHTIWTTPTGHTYRSSPPPPVGV